MPLAESESSDYRSKKGSDRISINSILCGVCIAALSVLLGLSREKLSSWTVGQLAIAVPLLITSSLCYAKVGYRHTDEAGRWDLLGWLGHSLGYAAVLNAIGILLYRSGFVAVAWVFVVTVLFLFLVYSIVDLHAKRKRIKEKLWKFMFYVSLLFAGMVLPILLGWV